jgi:uncharacterized protein YjbI with pentapeptide repeats
VFEFEMQQPRFERFETLSAFGQAYVFVNTELDGLRFLACSFEKIQASHSQFSNCLFIQSSLDYSLLTQVVFKHCTFVGCSFAFVNPTAEKILFEKCVFDRMPILSEGCELRDCTIIDDFEKQEAPKSVVEEVKKQVPQSKKGRFASLEQFETKQS